MKETFTSGSVGRAPGNRRSYPDLHALVPGGALADQGPTWNPTHPKFLFPVKALSTVFRANYLDGLRRLDTQQALRFTNATRELEAPKTFEIFLK
jgi:hypothetical protein